MLSHGYALSLDSWHYQRLALRGRYRLVLWDQRGHGRSGTGPAGSATIDQVGRDLAAVIDAVAPTGPLVLVGHSMGGMTVMSLAQPRPGPVRRPRGGRRRAGLDQRRRAARHRPRDGRPGRAGARRGAGRGPAALPPARLVERGRRLGSDLESVLVRHYSYASDVPGELVGFTARMIAATRIEVVSDFLPAFRDHDKRAALEALHRVESLVLVGDGDLLTPAAHSDEIVRRLPGAPSTWSVRGRRAPGDAGAPGRGQRPADRPDGPRAAQPPPRRDGERTGGIAGPGRYAVA